MRQSLIDRIVTLIGAPHVSTGIDCSPYVLEGRTPEAVVRPGTTKEVAGVLAAMAEAGVPVTPWGGGTKMTIGAPPAQLGLVLCLSRMSRLIDHEPGDLTATAQAGMTVAAFQAELGRRGQWLSLDPPQPERATLGGVLAAAASGPRRHLYGTPRDLLIGLTLVLADGSVVKGGGKVVKNVAGYDIPKLAIGSFGTLGVIVEATVKLRPRPDADRLVVARFDRLKDAGQGARAIVGSDLIPSAVDLVDGEGLRALGSVAEGAGLLIGVDGTSEQVDWQCAEIPRLLGGLGLAEHRVLDGATRDAVWAARGELSRRVFREPAAIMRWSVLPVQVADQIEQAGGTAQRNGLRASFAAHAGVGVVTAALSGEGAAADAVVATLVDWRAQVRAGGGHALLEWAPLAIKERVPVWEPPGAAHRVMRRIKDQLDPRGILNPGRWSGGP
ncbi:MAG: FAD-binding oxidoreductase [Candidatus Rokubacteria bacterium]|nr:FAD-binding oxidoreductase [Candidatus Rokubacteria bacterium]